MHSLLPGTQLDQHAESMKVSFLEKIQAARTEALAQSIDPWRLALERARGKVEFDPHERVSSQTLLDLLEVPQRSRRAGTYGIWLS
jgi:hypothetical protein